MGTLIDVGTITFGEGHGGVEDIDVDEKIKSELSIIRSLLQVAADGSPLVRAEVAVGMCNYQNILSVPENLDSLKVLFWVLILLGDLPLHGFTTFLHFFIAN